MNSSLPTHPATPQQNDTQQLPTKLRPDPPVDFGVRAGNVWHVKINLDFQSMAVQKDLKQKTYVSW